jgi:hypothetical protein
LEAVLSKEVQPPHGDGCLGFGQRIAELAMARTSIGRINIAPP